MQVSIHWVLVCVLGGSIACADRADAGALAVAASDATALGRAGAAAADGGGVEATRCDGCCRDGLPRGVAHGGARRIAALRPSPEGVSVCPGGEVFVARDQSGEVWRVPMDGSAPELWAKLGDRRPAGIACDEQGRLFVATFATISGDDASLGALLITAKEAAPIELPQPSDGPAISGLNGIVAVPGVGVYATDSANGSILLMQESAAGGFETRTVAKGLSTGNGLAYDADSRALYAVSSGSWELFRYTVAEDGALSDRVPVTVAAAVWFMDGVAVGEGGAIYVADWLGGSVLHAQSGKAVAGVTNPASMAFRGGTLLVTDYKLLEPDAEGGLYAIDLGMCGASSVAQAG